MSNDQDKGAKPGDETSAGRGASATDAKPSATDKGGVAAGTGADSAGKKGGNAPGRKGSAGRRGASGRKGARDESAGKDSDAPAGSGDGKPAADGSPAPAETGATGRSQGAALLIATLAFLLALGVGGAQFYLWQSGEASRAEQTRQSERLAAELQARAEQLSRLEGALERESEAREGLAGRTDTRLATVEQGLTRLQDRTTRQERGWQVAEVKHLQRMAAHRLRLMDDPEGALRALQAADELLAELGDPRLLPVREALAGEMQALQDMPRPDVAGLAMRLESLAGELRPLPLRGQGGEASGTRELLAGTPVPDSAPWWQRAWGELRAALAEQVSIRRHAEPVRALPDAATELFLRQLLTLRLEAARVAVLRLDDARYRSSLDGALALLDDHFDADAAAAVRERLESLRSQTLRPEAPDISGSFTLLNELEG